MDLISVEEKELLIRATKLMEELRESIEVIEDKETVEDLKAALAEADSGNTRPLSELVRELDLEEEV